MRKKILLLCFALMLLVAMTGCGSETHTINISSTGGSIVSEMLFSKEIYDYLLEADDRENVPNLEEYGDVSYVTVDGVEYIKLTRVITCGSINELNNKLDDLNAYLSVFDTSDRSDLPPFFEEIQVDVNRNRGQIIVSGEITEDAHQYNEYNCVIIFKFAGELISTNIGEKVDPHTVKIDYLSIIENQDYGQFKIVAEIESLLPIILASTIAILTVGALVVGVIILRKKDVEEEILVAETEDNQEADNTIEE